MTHNARWQSERGASPPQQVQLADDRMNADTAYGLACQGVGLLWRGDFQNARQLLNALGNRVIGSGLIGIGARRPATLQPLQPLRARPCQRPSIASGRRAPSGHEH